MNDKASHKKETQTAMFQGKPITLTHITPILSPEQRDKRKREVEHQLYEVFSKYKELREKVQ